MIDPIRKGDLCIVVGPIPWCGRDNWLGKMVTAHSDPFPAIVRCPACLHHEVHDVVCVDPQSMQHVYPRSGLRRIPPLADLETTQTTEGAPA